jgi:DNA helicase IV
VGRALARGGTIVVAGDANQQVDPTSDFPGWEGVMEETGAGDHERATLEISYRCPPEVTEVGRHVLKPVAGSTIAASIPRARHEDPLHLHAWLVDELRSLQSEDPSAILALICRSEGMARTFAKVLAPPLDARLVRLEDFDFHPGVLLTSAPEVKGLEFDYVVIPDADATVYPETAESRRTLYVALTRATDRLALACAGAWSPLLPAADR